WQKLPPEYDANVDSQLMPNAGLSKSVAVLSFSPKTSERLLASTPLAVTPDGPLADRKKPLASAVYFNWASTVDALGPWIDLAVRQVPRMVGGAGQFADASDDPSTRMILDQARTFLEILKVLRTAESATYEEGGATVTHSLTVFHDVE